MPELRRISVIVTAFCGALYLLAAIAYPPTQGSLSLLDRLRMVRMPAECPNYTHAVPLADTHKVDLLLVQNCVSKNVTSASTMIVYNRVPKCGSITVHTVIEALAKQNSFNYLSSQVYNTLRLSSGAEETLVRDLHATKTPWIYDRHVRLLNFTEYGLEMPHYINVYREPAERRRSQYYYNCPLYRKSNISYDECIARRHPYCTRTLNYLQYFCGHQQTCKRSASDVLQIVKQNVERYYDVVGLNEDLESFFRLLEHRFPEMFRGAVTQYRQTSWQNSDRKRESHQMLNATRSFLKERLWVEYAFYDFIKQRFNMAMTEIM